MNIRLPEYVEGMLTTQLGRSVLGKPPFYIQDVSGGKVNILRGHSIGHSKQKSVYVHVSYSERFPR
jgi:hypothetical protein